MDFDILSDLQVDLFNCLTVRPLICGVFTEIVGHYTSRLTGGGRHGLEERFGPEFERQRFRGTALLVGQAKRIDCLMLPPRGQPVVYCLRVDNM